MKTFQEVIDGISEVLGPTSGLDCEEIDHKVLIDLMSQYTSNESDWIQYALTDPRRLYTRNLVADTNKKSNILVLVWVCMLSSCLHDTDGHRILAKARQYTTMRTHTVS